MMPDMDEGKLVWVSPFFAVTTTPSASTTTTSATAAARGGAGAGAGPQDGGGGSGDTSPAARAAWLRACTLPEKVAKNADVSKSGFSSASRAKGAKRKDAEMEKVKGGSNIGSVDDDRFVDYFEYWRSVYGISLPLSPASSHDHEHHLQHQGGYSDGYSDYDTSADAGNYAGNVNQSRGVTSSAVTSSAVTSSAGSGGGVRGAQCAQVTFETSEKVYPLCCVFTSPFVRIRDDGVWLRWARMWTADSTNITNNSGISSSSSSSSGSSRVTRESSADATVVMVTRAKNQLIHHLVRCIELVCIPTTAAAATLATTTGGTSASPSSMLSLNFAPDLSSSSSSSSSSTTSLSSQAQKVGKGIDIIPAAAQAWPVTEDICAASRTTARTASDQSPSSSSSSSFTPSSSSLVSLHSGSSFLPYPRLRTAFGPARTPLVFASSSSSSSFSSSSSSPSSSLSVAFPSALDLVMHEGSNKENARAGANSAGGGGDSVSTSLAKLLQAKQRISGKPKHHIRRGEEMKRERKVDWGAVAEQMRQQGRLSGPSSGSVGAGGSDENVAYTSSSSSSSLSLSSGRGKHEGRVKSAFILYCEMNRKRVRADLQRHYNGVDSGGNNIVTPQQVTSQLVANWSRLPTIETNYFHQLAKKQGFF